MTDSAVRPDGFDAANFERWQALASKALKGAPLDDLMSQTDDGLAIQPLYASSSSSPVSGRGGGIPWTIAQTVDHPDAKSAHRQVMSELEGGASGLYLVAQGAPSGFGYGVDLASLSPMLDDVLVDAVRFTLQTSAARARDARSLAAYLDGRSTPNSAIHVDFGLDAPSVLAATGGLRGTGSSTRDAQAGHFDQLLDHGFGGTIYRADSRTVHNGGGTDVDELAFLLASLVFAMKSGGDPALAAQKTLLGVAVDADQFAGIAKLRALRILHQTLLEASGITPFPARIHAVTSGRMLTASDAHVNMLRTTTAVFAAAVGGADILTALPFSLPLGYPDPFARRAARNTQLVLLEESQLHQVEDPAAGSGLYDTYTQALCASAWEAFQAIEREGGVVEALASGHIQNKVAASRSARDKAFADGARHLTGTTIFQLETEYPVEVEDVSPSSTAMKDDLKTYATAIEPLPWGGTP